MTISSQNSQTFFAGNGVTTSFSFSFIAGVASNIVAVYTDATGVSAQLTQGAQYTVTLNAPSVGQIWGVGGSVTYTVGGAAIPTGSTLSVSRVVPLTQLVSISNQGDFYPQAVEKALDVLCMEIQQVASTAARAIVINPADVALPVPLPVAAQRANKILAFDNAGQPTVISAIDQSGETVTATGGIVAASLAQRFGTILNVKDDFGAKGDGVTDDGAAILACQAAVAAKGGGVVFYPPGVYATTKTIAITVSNIRHIGSGRGGNHDTNPVVTAATSLLWIGSNGGVLTSVVPPAGAQRVVGWGLEEMALVSGVYPYASSAAVGCLLSSCAFGKLKVTTIEFTGQAVATNCIDGLGENNLMQFNVLDIVARQINTSGTVLQMAGNASASSNTCFNRIYLSAEYQNGIGIDVQDADNNTFYETYLQLVSGGSGIPLVLRGTSAGTTPGSARNNVFFHFSQSIFGGQILSEGVGTYGSRVITVPAMDNQIVFFDRANGPFNLAQGTNSTLFAGFNDCPFGQSQNFLGNQTGYIADTRGVYEVWGSAGTLAANSTTVISFPNGLSLPNNIFYSLSASINGSSGQSGNYSIVSANATSFTMFVGTAGVWNWRIWGR